MEIVSRVTCSIKFALIAYTYEIVVIFTNKLILARTVEVISGLHYIPLINDIKYSIHNDFKARGYYNFFYKNNILHFHICSHMFVCMLAQRYYLHAYRQSCCKKKIYIPSVHMCFVCSSLLSRPEISRGNSWDVDCVTAKKIIFRFQIIISYVRSVWPCEYGALCDYTFMRSKVNNTNRKDRLCTCSSYKFYCS